MKYQMLLSLVLIPILGTWLHSVHTLGYVATGKFRNVYKILVNRTIIYISILTQVCQLFTKIVLTINSLKHVSVHYRPYLT